MNNRRDWFLEHKQQYVDTLYEPMKALAAEISAPFAEIPGMVCKTSRIYRDMRMAPPEPYKESLWICIRRENDWWVREPALFFEIRPDGYGYGFLLWEPTVAAMDAFRRDIAARPDAFLQLVRQTERGSGIKLEGKSYQRRKPCPDPRLEPYYSLRSVTAYCERPVEQELFSAQLADTVRRTLLAQYPLCGYFQQFTGAIS